MVAASLDATVGCFAVNTLIITHIFRRSTIVGWSVASMNYEMYACPRCKSKIARAIDTKLDLHILCGRIWARIDLKVKVTWLWKHSQMYGYGGWPPAAAFAAAAGVGLHDMTV